MVEMTFPEPVVPGGPSHTNDQALDVLEKAADLLQIVKGYEYVNSEEWLRTYMFGADGATPAIRFELRRRVLDVAMDVYRAVSCFIGGPVQEGACVVPENDWCGVSSGNALGVLCSAAGLFSEAETGWGRHDESNAESVVWGLACLLIGEFIDKEVADAYERCLGRNRERGRL